MKYETFNSMLENAKNLYDEAVKRDNALQTVLGGDTQVMTDWWSMYIESIVAILEKEYNDETGSVDWLFWESICNSGSYQDFTIDGAIYEGSPLNVWLDLEGKLDEKFSKGFVEKEYNENDNSTLFKEKPVGEVLPDDFRATKEDVEVQNKGFNSLSKEDTEHAHKLILLKDKQIALESVELAKELNAMVSDIMVDESVSIGGYIVELDKAFKSLAGRAKHVEIITKITNSFRMVLLNLVGEILDENTLNMANFEVTKVLNNLKEFGSLFDYSVKQLDNTISGVIIWEADGEPTGYSVELAEEIKVIFN